VAERIDQLFLAKTPVALHRALSDARLTTLLEQPWRSFVASWRSRDWSIQQLIYRPSVGAKVSLGKWLLSPKNGLSGRGYYYARSPWEAVRELLYTTAREELTEQLLREAAHQLIGERSLPPAGPQLAEWCEAMGVGRWLTMPVQVLDLDLADRSGAKWLDCQAHQVSTLDALSAPPWTAKSTWRRGSKKVPETVQSVARSALLRHAALRHRAEQDRPLRPALTHPSNDTPNLAALARQVQVALEEVERDVGPVWFLTVTEGRLTAIIDPPEFQWSPRGASSRQPRYDDDLHEPEDLVARRPPGGVTIIASDPLQFINDCAPWAGQERCPPVRDALDTLLRFVCAEQRPLHETLEVELGRSPLDRFLGDIAPALEITSRPSLGLELRRDKDGPWLALLDVDESGKRPKLKTRGFKALDLDAVTDPEEQQILNAMLRGNEPEEMAPATWKRLAHRPHSIAATLMAARGSSHLYMKDGKRRPMHVRRIAPTLFVDDSDGLRMELRLDDQPLSSEDLVSLAQASLAAPVPFIDWASDTVTVVPITGGLRALARTLLRRGGEFGTSSPEALLPNLAALETVTPLTLGEGMAGAAVPADGQLLVRLELVGAGLRLTLFTEPLMDGGLRSPGAGSETVYGSVDGARVHAHRDLSTETAHALLLQGALHLGPPDDSDLAWSWIIEDPTMAAEVVAGVGQRNDVRVQWRGRAGRTRRGPGLDKLAVRFASLGTWFGVEGELSVGKRTLSLSELLLAAEQGRRFVALGPGDWLQLNDELMAALEPLAAAVRSSPDRSSVSALHAPLLGALTSSEAKLDAPPEWMSGLERVAQAAALDAPVPPSLQAELRDYQRAGFRWLSRLAHWAGGAVLADDMGLGKTVQALALLLRRSADGPALVVAPTSVGFNWVRESQRFAPSLTTLEYRGPGRAQLLTEAGAGTVLVTSWALMARDVDALAEVSWSTVVFDEAQAMKNRMTRRNKAARSLTAGFRLALTGTPLENHAGELYALMAVIVPGLLGGPTQFQERFLGPIQRKDESATTALARLVSPFVLRRLKRDVATELPARTEVEVLVELSRPERALYERVREAAVAELELATTLGQQRRRFQALGLLTRLRQAACHPRLLDPESDVSSSKLERTIQLLEQLRAEGHKALVFSQFVRHLRLVREALEGRGWRLLYLDGSTPTRRRAELVDRFQTGDADAFLISLKAGGTGLNLTAATYVIHMDPWWNPAAEDQATDRTHRIGQERAVTVYRLVARDTVEEAIVRLHRQKRELADALLAGTGSGRALSPDQLVALFMTQGDAPQPLPAPVEQVAEVEEVEVEEAGAPEGAGPARGEWSLIPLIETFLSEIPQQAERGELSAATARSYANVAQDLAKWFTHHPPVDWEAAQDGMTELLAAVEDGRWTGRKTVRHQGRLVLNRIRAAQTDPGA